jgi:hypothetical protein
MLMMKYNNASTLSPYTFLSLAHVATLTVVPFLPHACRVELEMRQE